ncbi:hypothetical protein LX36DRAFT_652518 [Colletotrichum falcatum]|nr:hypothetical protein LX36DRAFT_652518 [Colletotrichum falcatum]
MPACCKTTQRPLHPKPILVIYLACSTIFSVRAIKTQQSPNAAAFIIPVAISRYTTGEEGTKKNDPPLTPDSHPPFHSKNTQGRRPPSTIHTAAS